MTKPNFKTILSNLKNIESNIISHVTSAKKDIVTNVGTGARAFGGMISNSLAPKKAYAAGLTKVLPFAEIPNSAFAPPPPNTNTGTSSEVTHYIINVNDSSRGEEENYVVDYTIPNDVYDAKKPQFIVSPAEVTTGITAAEIYNTGRPSQGLNSPTRIIHVGMPYFNEIRQAVIGERIRLGSDQATLSAINASNLETVDQSAPNRITQIYRKEPWNVYTEPLPPDIPKDMIGLPINYSPRSVGQYPAATTTRDYFNAVGPKYQNENHQFLDDQEARGIPDKKKIQLKDSAQFKGDKQNFINELNVLQAKSENAQATVRRYTGDENYYPVVSGAYGIMKGGTNVLYTNPRTGQTDKEFVPNGFGYMVDQNKNVFGNIQNSEVPEGLRSNILENIQKFNLNRFSKEARDKNFVLTGWK